MQDLCGCCGFSRVAVKEATGGYLGRGARLGRGGGGPDAAAAVALGSRPAYGKPDKE